MSSSLISLDISRAPGSDIDISVFFPLTELGVDVNTGQEIVEDFLLPRPELDFSLNQRVQVDPFHTIETLDLALRELVDEGYGRWGRISKPTRPQTINLLPPLEYIPYGALDIRREQPIRTKRTYPDLFRRSLPRSLRIRRNYQETKKYLRAKRRPILVGIATFLAICLPMIGYIKYSIDHGYRALASLGSASSLKDIQDAIRTAKGDFERAEFLFLPFSWLPGETVDTARRGIRGGTMILQALNKITSTLPSATGSLAPVIREETASTVYRGSAKDIFF